MTVLMYVIVCAVVDVQTPSREICFWLFDNFPFVCPSTTLAPISMALEACVLN